MLTESYIEALLADEELADSVWEAWDKKQIDDFAAVWAWWTIAARLPSDRYTLRSGHWRGKVLKDR
jgi:hypothetical protein